MINGKTVIGIVPARSGSKGIPGKNIRPLAGKPLMAWAIEGGKKSGVLDKIFVMTDSPEYAAVGKQYCAEAPVLLAPEVATDTSHVFHAMKWYLGKLAERGIVPDYVVLLEPTAPGRQAAHIEQLVTMVAKDGADAGFTVMDVPPGFNAHWQIAVAENGKAELAMGGPVSGIIRRRQLLPPLYVRGGSTYVSKKECLMKEEPDMYGTDARALLVDRKFAVDLDNEEDWKEAEKIVPELHGM